MSVKSLGNWITSALLRYKRRYSARNIFHGTKDTTKEAKASSKIGRSKWGRKFEVLLFSITRANVKERDWKVWWRHKGAT